MYFPIWQYLNQPIWDSQRPLILDPARYWQYYKAVRLNNCLENAFLERCWQINYSSFVDEHYDICSRVVLEEDPIWLMERCWQLKQPDRSRRRAYQHPTD